ncbi:hypothetical protein [Corynebacterium confusum]
MVTSNGAGLGHLTRLNAVSKWLDAEILFYTMSSAYYKLGKARGDIIYFPSYGDLGMNGRQWNSILKPHFSAAVGGFEPDIVVFDGTFVYRPVSEVCREKGVPLVWMQRGCWKEEVDLRSKQRHDAASICDAVLIPGDYGCREQVNSGKGVKTFYLSPVVVTGKESKLSSAAAKEELGLPVDKKLFLIQVGAGVINDISHLERVAVNTVAELGDDWRPVVVSNPLKSSNRSFDAEVISAYPLGDYYAAFDAGVFAAGYNTVQESVGLVLPGIFVPNLATKTDDQLRRARGIEARGLGLVATTQEELRLAIRRYSDDEYRSQMRLRMLEVTAGDGAKEAAELIQSGLSRLLSRENEE